jgi:hypothetical protein
MPGERLVREASPELLASPPLAGQLEDVLSNQLVAAI